MNNETGKEILRKGFIKEIIKLRDIEVDEPDPYDDAITTLRKAWGDAALEAMNKCDTNTFQRAKGMLHEVDSLNSKSART